ncbi:MAG TPA: hypothetical protein DCL41_07040 [Bdellovibrionales bacterium]|nr:hypothetical protein [Pseudobdellovibrionaceae bacterium]HAG91609.1 hypothetical protein [Bdellovibrionales bacterium]|tara:strand:+ start:204 stop:767 length:564 start_codon:yes stop_codon:yes gene_type:complete
MKYIFLLFIVAASSKLYAENKSPAFIKGKKIASELQMVLGKNLLAAIQSKGTVGAIAFCNERAYPITNATAKKEVVFLKRATDKPRNPKNLADQSEAAVISKYKRQLERNISLNPILKEVDEGFEFYSPILTNAMCLQCHGSPKKEISDGVLAKLQTLYPKDQAMGYSINQLRGVFSVRWKKKSSVD